MGKDGEAKPPQKHHKKHLADDEEDDSKIFPQRLMEILADEENQEAICWLPHGRAFQVRNRNLFAEKVMPRYFSRKAKYSSFTRKLNRWSFVRVSSGPEVGAYYHEFFLRDKPHLAAQMFCKNARTMLAMATSDEKPTPLVRPSSPASNPTGLPAFLQPPEVYAAATAVSAPLLMEPQQQQLLGSNTPISPALLAALTKAPDNDNFQNKHLYGSGTSNIRLLEHILQQEQANRFLVERAMALSLVKQRQEEQNKLIKERARLLQMRQLMQLRAQQQDSRNPANPRASAA